MVEEGDQILSSSSSYQDISFSIMGGGAFSLALAKVLSYKGIKTSLLVRDQKVADEINEKRFHPKYLTNCEVPKTMWATANPQLCLHNANFVIHAVPMQSSREFLEINKKFIPDSAPILSVTKGVEQTTFCLMNDVIAETLGKDKVRLSVELRGLQLYTMTTVFNTAWFM